MAVFNPAESGLFEKWSDPASGITSYLLTRREAPLQQSFYFVTPSITTDGRYVWVRCVYPSSDLRPAGEYLAIIDFENDDFRVIPETLSTNGAPFVDQGDGSIYWCSGYSVFMRSPDPGAEPVLVNSIPEEVHRNRNPGGRIASHLTLSADGAEFFMDADFTDEWIAGSLPLSGGDYKLWQVFDRCYNHAQFNPVDKDFALIAQDWWDDTISGEVRKYDNRIWIIRRGEEAYPVFEFDNFYGHEWWDAGGESIWYVDYNKGTYLIDISSGVDRHVWPSGNGHSHSSSCGRYVVGDIDVYSWEKRGCRIAFYNIETGKEVNIVTSLPRHPLTDDYHIHPHPRFCAGDSCIAYTTTVKGEADVALTSVAALIDATT